MYFARVNSVLLFLTSTMKATTSRSNAPISEVAARKQLVGTASKTASLAGAASVSVGQRQVSNLLQGSPRMVSQCKKIAHISSAAQQTVVQRNPTLGQVASVVAAGGAVGAAAYTLGMLAGGVVAVGGALAYAAYSTCVNSRASASPSVPKKKKKPSSQGRNAQAPPPRKQTQNSHSGAQVVAKDSDDEFDDIEQQIAQITAYNKNQIIEYERVRRIWQAIQNWESDRSPNTAPSHNAGQNYGSMRVDGLENPRPYHNNQNYLPGGLGGFTESTIAQGTTGQTGNHRSITSNRAHVVGGNHYERWVGIGITHGATPLMRVWNTTLGYWQRWEWDVTANSYQPVDFPFHDPAPHPPRLSLAERKLAQEGPKKKTSKVVGFGLQVTVEQIPAYIV